MTAVKPTLDHPPIFDCLMFFERAVFIDRVVDYGMTQFFILFFWLILTIETIKAPTTSQISFDKYEVRGEVRFTNVSEHQNTHISVT